MKMTFVRNTLIGISVAIVSGLAAALSYPPQYAYMYNAPSYDNQYIPAYGQNDASYTYTTGCNTYRYDGYSRTSALISTTCTTNNYWYGYNANYYPQYAQPVQQVTYVPPITHTYYVAPITTTYTLSPVYSNGYNNYGNYGYGYNNGYYTNQNYSYYNNGNYYPATDLWINNGYVDINTRYTNIGNCYYSNGYQVCP